MALTLYGIKSCGTVKKARKWLEARDVPYEFVDFRAEPPTADQVDAWVAEAGTRAMRNTSGGAYRTLGMEKDTWPDARWTRAYTEDPMLIKRPLIERDGTLIKVGFRGTDEELEALLLA